MEVMKETVGTCLPQSVKHPYFYGMRWEKTDIFIEDKG
jgi:hypothetical protein